LTKGVSDGIDRGMKETNTKTEAGTVQATRTKRNKTAVILAPHYREVVIELFNNEIIQDMARGIKNVPIEKIVHDDGGPRFEFMMASNEEFRNRGGSTKGSQHIGAVAEALVALLTCDASRRLGVK